MRAKPLRVGVDYVFLAPLPKKNNEELSFGYVDVCPAAAPRRRAYNLKSHFCHYSWTALIAPRFRLKRVYSGNKHRHFMLIAQVVE